MSQAAAEAAVDSGSAVIAGLHQLLHDLELFSGGERFIQLDSGGRGQLDDAVLGEILDAAADIAAPLIPHGIRVGVHRDKGELVQPAGDSALRIDKAGGFTGTHSDAENVVCFKTHGTGQRGDIPVVDDGVGNVAEGIRDGADIDVLDLFLKEILRNLEKERGVHGAIVDVDAGGGDADSVYPRQMLRGRLQCGDDAVVVVIRVSRGLRKPYNFFGIDRLPIDDGRDLPVAAAGVKADPAAAQMTADRLRLVVRRGELFRREHFKRMLKDF